VANDLYTQLIQLGTTREDVIIALGGGVVGDLAGFVASTFLRGVPFIQVPTTVLAQVDSSVGGKVGINHALGKNLIGSFYHPSFVLIDPLVLETLDERERSAGFAEVIKYGLIADKTFFHTLQNNIDSLIQLSDFKLLQTVLERCCQIKVDIVQADEKEKGLRAILNFGHTLGHALEAVTNYEYFLHGEAVAWGMIGALYLSEKYDFNQDIKSVIHLIEKLSIPELPVNIAAGQIIHAIKRDKKRKRSGQVWVLLEQIGHAYLEQNIPTDLVREATEYMIRQKVGI
jgi:3-dehydroquinate synthase